VLRAGIPLFSVLVATLGVATQFQQHGFLIALSIVTYIFSIGMAVFGASVQSTNLDSMSLLISNTPGWITTYVERWSLPPPRQPGTNCHGAKFVEDSTCVDTFCVF